MSCSGNLRELADHAISYAAAGFEVHPLVPGSDEPLTRSGVADATSDVVKVAAWWRWWPDANIGLRVPEGVLVVECSMLGFIDHHVEHHVSKPFPSTATISGLDRILRWYACESPSLRLEPDAVERCIVHGPGDSILAPPSLGPWNRPLSWVGSDLRTDAPATAPAWLIGELSDRRPCPFWKVFP